MAEGFLTYKFWFRNLGRLDRRDFVVAPRGELR